MRTVLIDVPYDCGQLRMRMGAGPELMAASWIDSGMTAARQHARRDSVRLPPGFHTEWDALVALQSGVSRLVSAALASGERPLILSCNCGPALLGALGATGSASTAVCWFDAHGDFNTPETSPSGFLDGMALAIAVGDCWPAAAQRFHGVSRLQAKHILHVGGRAFDPPEALRLEHSQIGRIGRQQLPTLSNRLRALAAGLHHLYLHIDLDVLDPSQLRANSYPEPDGLSIEELVAAIKDIGHERPWTVASLTSLDPSCDADRAPAVVQRLIDVLLDS